jgi:dTDP-4-amino-4,6-dideoxygalactose transaminase
MKVPFSYLDRQFAEIDDYLDDIRAVVAKGDYTLGAAVAEFERRFAAFVGLPHMVGVGSGTDALILPMKLLGIGPGDEVITAANTFIATVGAIVATGARPVLVDNEEGFVIDPGKIEDAITPKTKALLPVHYTGNVADMPTIKTLADRRGLLVIEDACQAIGAALGGKPAGSWAACAAFSVHPLKNVNVWGDGGLVGTTDGALPDKLRLYRNHGLADRDHVTLFGVNSRLDTLQAAVGNRLVHDAGSITARRIAIARRYDDAFAALAPRVRVPVRRKGVKHVFHLYLLRVERRDALKAYLEAAGVEAKIHYPIPIHLQKAAAGLGYRSGSFPVAEADAASIITLPAHQHLTDDEISYVIETVQAFYR